MATYYLGNLQLQLRQTYNLLHSNIVFINRLLTNLNLKYSVSWYNFVFRLTFILPSNPSGQIVDSLNDNILFLSIIHFKN